MVQQITQVPSRAGNIETNDPVKQGNLNGKPIHVIDISYKEKTKLEAGVGEIDGLQELFNYALYVAVIGILALISVGSALAAGYITFTHVAIAGAILATIGLGIGIINQNIVAIALSALIAVGIALATGYITFAPVAVIGTGLAAIYLVNSFIEYRNAHPIK